MHRRRLVAFVIDCKVDGLDGAAGFWSRALGRALLPAEAGNPTYRELESKPAEPMLLLQQVEHESRIHLDIESDDIDREAARLEALGARRIGFIKRWWVMEAPSGQRFCVVRTQGRPMDGATEWP